MIKKEKKRNDDVLKKIFFSKFKVKIIICILATVFDAVMMITKLSDLVVVCSFDDDDDDDYETI